MNFRDERKFLFSLVFLILFTVYSLTSRGGYDGYELENYLTAENIFLHQKISLASGYFNLPGIVNTNDGQEHFVRHGLLQPILEVPFYAVGYFISQFIHLKPPVVENSLSNIGLINPIRLMVVSLFNPLVTALTALLVGLIIIELKGEIFIKVSPLKMSLVAMLIYGLGTMAWPYAAIGLEPLMVLTLVMSFFFWLRWKNGHHDSNLIFLALGLALLINTKSYAWVFSLPFVLDILFKVRPSQGPTLKRSDLLRCLWFLAVVGLGFLIFFGFNLYKSGHLFGQDQTSYLNSISLSTILVNFLTMTISTGKSVFVYSPILILSLFGLHSFIKDYSKESRMIFLLFVIWSLLFLPLWYVSADEMWGPRYALPLVPFLTMVAITFLFKWLSLRIYSDVSLHRDVGTEHCSVPTTDKYSHAPVYQSQYIKLISVSFLLIISVFIQILGVLCWSTTPLKIAFAAGAKSMEEINFNPVFSPIVINTQLFLSTINHLSGKGSLEFRPVLTSAWAGQGGVPQRRIAVDLSKYDNQLVIWPARFFKF